MLFAKDTYYLDYRKPQRGRKYVLFVMSSIEGIYEMFRGYGRLVASQINCIVKCTVGEKTE